jgi:two-component system, sensor histidine kinase and response regulator
MEKKPGKDAAPEILIVDDMPANVQMLALMLKEKGYRVRTALGGNLALQDVQVSLPDLILLDINMPEIDGFELCRRLKADDKSREIPVIFVSSLSDVADKLKTFEVGGVDYVEKPFRFEEVLARIETHISIRKLQRELSCQNQRLEETVAERTGQLAEAHRRLAIMDRTKSDFLKLISHELRTPLNGIFGVAELLFSQNENDPAVKELRDMFNISQNSMMKILDDALLLTQLEMSGDIFSSQSVPLDFILESAMTSVEKTQSVPVLILPDCRPAGMNVQGDPKLLVKAFSYLLETASRFSSGEPVTVACKCSPSSVDIAISAKGRVIPADMIADFFDVFTVSKPIKDVGDLGLGPPVSKRIFSLFGCSVTARNDSLAGVTFTVKCTGN